MTPCLLSNSAQVHQARTVARAEAEAAAEQRVAAALAHEHAELAKQARSLLCKRSSRLRCPSLVLRRVCAASWNGLLQCMLQHRAWGGGAQLG